MTSDKKSHKLANLFLLNKGLCFANRGEDDAMKTKTQS